MKIQITLFLVLNLGCLSVLAQSNQRGTLGAGVILGEPTGPRESFFPKESETRSCNIRHQTMNEWNRENQFNPNLSAVELYTNRGQSRSDTPFNNHERQNMFY